MVVTHGPTVSGQDEGGVGRFVRLAGGEPGRLVDLRGVGLRLTWRPEGSDAYASAGAWGLTSEDLVAFVSGLAPRLGGPSFDATVLPDGIEEDPIEPPADPGQMWIGYRVVDLAPEPEAADDGLGPVHVTVMRGDDADFGLTLAARAAAGGAIEQVTVLGRPAVLLGARGTADWWPLLWRQNAADRVEVRIAATDRTDVDRVIAALDEVDARAFTDMVREAGERTPEDTPPSTTLAPRD